MQPTKLFTTSNDIEVYKFLGPDGSFWIHFSWDKAKQSFSLPVSDAKEIAVGLYSVLVGPREPDTKGVSEF